MKNINEILAQVDEKPWMGRIWRTPQIKEAIRLAQLEVIKELEQNIEKYGEPGEGIIWTKSDAFQELKDRINGDV